MSFTLGIKTDFSPQEVTEVIRSALEHEKHVAKYKVERYSMICANFESKYEFDSGALKEKFETGIKGGSRPFSWLALAICRAGRADRKRRKRAPPPPSGTPLPLD